jgi:hypothetical protein
MTEYGIPVLLMVLMIAGVVNDIVYRRRMRRASVRQWIVRQENHDLEDTLTDLGLGRRIADLKREQGENS